MFKFTIVAVLCSFALLAASEEVAEDAEKKSPLDNYDNKYEVKDPNSGCFYGHREVKGDDGITYGQYQVLLPDNRLQVVKYCVDKKGGYKASVEYITPPKGMIKPKEEEKTSEKKEEDKETQDAA